MDNPKSIIKRLLLAVLVFALVLGTARCALTLSVVREFSSALNEESYSSGNVTVSNGNHESDCVEWEEFPGFPDTNMHIRVHDKDSVDTDYRNVSDIMRRHLTSQELQRKFEACGYDSEDIMKLYELGETGNAISDSATSMFG